MAPFNSFYIIGTIWDVFMTVVIGFTWLETKGLTLEQIDQLFHGVPRKQLLSMGPALHGEKPTDTMEMDDTVHPDPVTVEETKVPVKN